MKKTFSIFLALALVLAFSLVAATPVMAQSWLTGWKYRVEITIDSNKIDGALTNFPVLLYLSTSSGIGGDDVSFVFNELQNDNNRKKIAVTTSDGQTPCYVEIEKWDDANKEAWLWVKVPSISSSADTTLYFYYDHTQPDNTTWVGDTNSAAAENVWDSDFMVVYHMADGADTSHVYDSTSRSHDGTKTGANAPQETTIAKMGVAQVFDGLNDQITLTAGDLDDLDTATIEICAKFHTISGSGDGGGLWAFIESSTDRAHLKSVSSDELRLYDDIDNVSHGTSTTDSPFDTTNWFQTVVTLDSGGLWTAYINNTQKFTQDDNKTFADLDNGFQTHIGSKQYASSLYHDGELDEFRVSKTVRVPAWMKATYHSNNDSLLSYGRQAVCIATATSTGMASFTSSAGTITGLTAVAETSLPAAAQATKPINFPDGLFSFTITGLPNGATVTVTITLPAGSAPTQYWKYHAGGWVQIPMTVVGPPNVIRITLVDGGLGDSGPKDGTIVDPGGSGNPGVGWETYPTNKVRVLLPWIALVAAVAAGIAILTRRLKAQS